MPTSRHTDPRDREPSAQSAEGSADAAAPTTADPSIQDRVLALQRSAGNAAVGRLMRAEATITDADRNRVQEARAFWMRLTGTPARQAPAAASAPAEIVGALPEAASAGGQGGNQADPVVGAEGGEQAPAYNTLSGGIVGASGGEAAPVYNTLSGGIVGASGGEAAPVYNTLSGGIVGASGGEAAPVYNTPAGGIVGASGGEAAPVYGMPRGPEAPVGAEQRPGSGNYVNPVNPVVGAGVPGNYNAPVTRRAPAAQAEAEAAAAPLGAEAAKPAKGWAGLRAAVKPAGPGAAKILPGREGPIKMLEWSQYWLEAIDPAHRPGHDLESDFQKWQQSGWDLTFWEWLDAYGTSRRQVNYLDTQAERQKYMLLAKDQKLWQEREKYSTLNAFAPFGGASGWAIFVVSAAGTFYGAEAREGKFHHSSIMAGAAVRAAGEIRVEGGTLVGITPYSGHYRPGNDHLLYALQQLESRGVDIAGAAVGHVTDEGRKCTWLEAKDYLVNGEHAKPAPRPAGHPR